MQQQTAIRAAVFSLVMALVILALKFIAYFVTDSMAILSDALESIVNVVAAGFALIIMRQAVEPADKDHPYGHGKFEYLSSAFEGGLISFAAVFIIFESLQSLVRGRDLSDLGQGIVWALAAAALNLITGLVLLAVAKKEKSAALKASGQHVLSDVVTTVAAMIGLGIVYVTGANWVDSAIAILVAIGLGWTGLKLVRQSAGGLIDESDPESLRDLAGAMQKARLPGIIDLHELRMIRSGRFHHVDAHLVLPEFWDVASAHEFSNAYEDRVVQIYPYDGEIAFHVDPCKKRFCNICDLQTCPVRVRPFLAQRVLTPEQIVDGPQFDEI